MTTFELIDCIIVHIFKNFLLFRIFSDAFTNKAGFIIGIVHSIDVVV